MNQIESPTMPDPANDPVLRWGILGAGGIASTFVKDLQQHTGQRVVAVGARDADRASRFAADHGIENSYGSYEALVDSRPDVIYVATTHPQHRAHGLMALEAGIPVLIEKPVGLDAADVAVLQEASQRLGVFCAEALWSVFTPTWRALTQTLAAVGPAHTVMADLGQTINEGHRMLEPGLAGGPLHDMGLYTATLITRVLGSCRQAAALKTDHPAGVAGQIGATLLCERGLGLMHTSLLGKTPTMGFIQTHSHAISLDSQFYRPGGFTVTPLEGRVESGPWSQVRRFEEPAGLGGLHWQAGAVARAIVAGQREFTEHPLSASLATAEAMDAVRTAAGIDLGAAYAARG